MTGVLQAAAGSGGRASGIRVAGVQGSARDVRANGGGGVRPARGRGGGITVEETYLSEVGRHPNATASVIGAVLATIQIGKRFSMLVKVIQK